MASSKGVAKEKGKGNSFFPELPDPHAEYATRRATGKLSVLIGTSSLMEDQLQRPTLPK